MSKMRICQTTKYDESSKLKSNKEWKRVSKAHEINCPIISEITVIILIWSGSVNFLLTVIFKCPMES
jgi:hypothetical protein